MGSRQADDLRAHPHSYGVQQLVAAGTGAGVVTGGNAGAGTTANTGGSETRPVNVAYAPRIHA